MEKKLFTSESVGAGHPDKICDQISDAVLDECLKQDKNARVACEVMASNRLIVVGGEITFKGKIDVKSIVRSVVLNLGYAKKDFKIINNINEQSPDISRLVDKENGELGAGDQGIMFGYANNETKNFMPLAITIANDLVELAEKERNGSLKGIIKADCKSQVTIDYTNPKAKRIHAVVMSIQHYPDIKLDVLRKKIYDSIIVPVVSKYKLNSDFETYINSAGEFILGGPIADTGLTGRKIIVDSYGGYAKHGGGAYSGKDSTKVDRSAAYAARWVAKNLVAAKVASEVELQLSYVIGHTQPLSISLNTLKDCSFSEEQVITCIRSVFDLSPKGIIDQLGLQRPIFLKTSTFGHFGREQDFSWEALNKVEHIRKHLNIGV
jgi:S-adenosylmethionine synthetase